MDTLSTSTATRLCLFPSPVGWVGVVHRNRTLVTLKFGAPVRARLEPEFPGLSPGPPADEFERSLAASLNEFLAGHPVSFAHWKIDREAFSPFRDDVMHACRTIPFGERWSYAQLAAAAGHPRASRAVGRVMRTNPLPLIVPCHRVVGGNGNLVGYSAATGIDMKRQLLALESGRQLKA